MLIIPSLCLAQVQTELHISVVVPPRPCEVGKQCDAISKEMRKIIVPSASITKDTIKYVGDAPTVTEQDNVKTILF